MTKEEFIAALQEFVDDVCCGEVDVKIAASPWYDSIYQAGLSKGYDNAYSDGYDTGFDVGYESATEDWTDR